MTAPVTEHIPAMCRFLVLRMREERRAALQQPGNPLAAIVLAEIVDRRALIRWVLSWADHRDGGNWRAYPDDNPATRNVRYAMEREHEMHGYALRYLLARYAEHPCFRPEWQVSR